MIAQKEKRRTPVSQTAEYALRAIVYLAGNPEEARITRDIAKHTQTPPSYLSKVLQLMVKADLLCSRRGLKGGFTLKARPSEISILDIVNAVDPLQRIDVCPLKLPEHHDQLCPLHRRLDEAMAATEEALRNTSIAEISVTPDSAEPLHKIE